MPTSTARERLQRALVELSRTGGRGRSGARRPLQERALRHGVDHAGAGAGRRAAAEGARPDGGPPSHDGTPAGRAPDRDSASAGEAPRSEGAEAAGPAMAGIPATAGDLADLAARLERIEAQLSALARPVDASRESFEEWVRLGYWAYLRFGEFLRLRRAGMI